MVSIIFKEIDFYQLFWLMCVYSVGGWVAETIVGIVRNKRFTNKGFLNGPYCIIYGIAAVIVTVGFEELQGILAVSVCRFRSFMHGNRMDCCKIH